MTESLLADRVNASTYRHKVAGLRLNDKTLAVQMRYRQKLRQAQRFVLDDDSVRLTCNLSHEQARLPHWSFLARLPHDPMWIEFNQHEKIKEFERMGALRHPFEPEHTSEFAGYLLYRDDPGSESPRWIAHGFMNDQDGDVLGSPLTYLFDPEGDPKLPLRGSTAWKAPTLSLRPGFPRMPVVIRTKNGQEIRLTADPELAAGGLYEVQGGKEMGATVRLAVQRDSDGSFNVDPEATAGLRGPEWLVARMAVIIDPWWEAHIGKSDAAKFNEHALTTCQEERGSLRWLITLLSAINGLPKTIKPVHPTRVRRVIGMNQVPYFSSYGLNLTIPREDRILRARTIIDRETRNMVHKRRWHMVRGHWRVVEFGRRTYLCRHQPTMVEHGLGICEKCELLVRWIDAHEAGDASIGVVDKTYQITT